MHRTSNLRWSDAWLLVSIYHCSKSQPANLSDIVAAADLINHAIITAEELRSGLTRLMQTDYIREGQTPLTFQCASQALQMLDGLSQKSKTLYELWKEVENHLEVVRWVAGEPLPHAANCHPFPGLSDEVYEKSIQEYLNRMRSRR